MSDQITNLVRLLESVERVGSPFRLFTRGEKQESQQNHEQEVIVT